MGIPMLVRPRIHIATLAPRLTLYYRIALLLLLEYREKLNLLIFFLAKWDIIITRFTLKDIRGAENNATPSREYFYTIYIIFCNITCHNQSNVLDLHDSPKMIRYKSINEYNVMIPSWFVNYIHDTANILILQKSVSLFIVTLFKVYIWKATIQGCRFDNC